MDKNVKIIQRIVKTKTEDVLHSSAYAKAQNRQAFGATSSEPFIKRQAIAEKRKFVSGYKNSHVATHLRPSVPPSDHSALPVEPATVTGPRSASKPLATTSKPPLQDTASSNRYSAFTPRPISAPRIPNRRPPAI